MRNSADRAVQSFDEILSIAALSVENRANTQGIADMYESKIVSAAHLSADFEQRIRPLQNMITTIGNCRTATIDDAALQDGEAAELRALVFRYELASSIARRRVDALVRETGIEALAGTSLIATRADRDAHGMHAAAGFLHRRIKTTLRRIDRLLPLVA